MASDRFTLVRKLDNPGGRNHAGIFLVKDRLKHDRLTILKRLSPEWGINEAEILQRLDHPHVVKLVHFEPATPDADERKWPKELLSPSPDPTRLFLWELDEHDCLYLELCSVEIRSQELHNLEDLVDELVGRDQKLPEMFVWQILVAILKALCYLHFGVDDPMTDSPVHDWERVAHGDINMGNIFLADPLPPQAPTAGSSSVEPAPSSVSAPSSSSPPKVYPRIVLGDFGEASSGHNDYRKRDLEQFKRLVYDLCQKEDTEERGDLEGEGLGDQSQWNKYSENLRKIVIPLNDLQKGHVAFLKYTQEVVKKMEELERAGTLVYDAL